MTSWDSDPGRSRRPRRGDRGAVTGARQRRRGFRDPKILLPFLLITLIWSSTWIVIKDQLGDACRRSGRSATASSSPAWRCWRSRGCAALRCGIGRGGHRARRPARPAPVRAQLQFRLRRRALHHLGPGRGGVRPAGRAQCRARLALLRRSGSAAASSLGSAVAMAGVGLLFVQEIRHSRGADRRGAARASASPWSPCSPPPPPT